MTPSTDKAAIRQTLRALKASGHEIVYVWDGEENERREVAR